MTLSIIRQSDCSQYSGHWLTEAINQGYSYCCVGGVGSICNYALGDPLGGSDIALKLTDDGTKCSCQLQPDGYKWRTEVFPDDNGSRQSCAIGYDWWRGYRLFFPNGTQDGWQWLKSRGNISHHSLRARDCVLYLTGGTNTNDISLRYLFRANFTNTYATQSINISSAFGSWIDFVVLNRAVTSSSGRGAVWVNGTKRIDVSGMVTASTTSNGNTKIGTYWGGLPTPCNSGRPYPFILYLDNYTLVRGAIGDSDATALAMVDPNWSGVPTTPTLLTPTFSPNGGPFDTSVSVSISQPENPDNLWYRTDGVTPTSPFSGSSDYLSTGPFTLTATSDVRAVAVKSGYNNSPMGQAIFTLSTSVLTAPTITPNGGYFDDIVTVSFSSPDDPDEYYYEIDGTTPTTGSTAYNNTPFQIEQDAVVKVFAVKSGYTDSPISTAIFDLEEPIYKPPKPTGLIFID